MKTSANYKSSTRPAILLVGPPGTGKSTLMTCFPEPYILELDANIDGPLTYKERMKIPGLVRFDIPHIIYDVSGNQIGVVPPDQRWNAMCRCLNAALKVDPTIETIGVDSLSALVEMALDEVRRQVNLFGVGGKDSKPPAMADLPISKDMLFNESLKDRTIDGALRIQDWGLFGGLLRKFFITLRCSGKTLVVSAHVVNDIDDDKVLRKFIKVPGQFRDEVAGLFTESWLTSAEERPPLKEGQPKRRVHFIQTIPTPRDEGLGLKTSLGLRHRFEVDLQEMSSIIKSTYTTNATHSTTPNPT